MEETLLELYRKLTDKEKLSLTRRELKALQKNFNYLQLEYDKLKFENEKLKKQIKEDEINNPSQMPDGVTHITAKTYLRLKKRFDAMQSLFWEVAKERNELRGDNKCDKL